MNSRPSLVSRSPADPEAQFDRRAWLTLAAVTLLLAMGIAVLAYRFTLPTDGWQANFREGNAFLYSENLMGAPSGLRTGDRVVSVAGFRATDLVPPSQLQTSWQAGAVLAYTVNRDGVERVVPVTLAQWHFGTWLFARLRQPSGLGGFLAPYLLLGISAFVFGRRPGNPAAGAFLLLTTTITFSELLTGTLPYSWPEKIDPLMMVVNGPWANILLYAGLFPFVLIRFALVFPRPKPMLQRWPWLTVAPSLIGFTLSLIPGPNPWGWFWFIASLLLMVLILAHTAFTTRDAVGRAQVLWGVSGLILGFGLLTAMLIASTFDLMGAASTAAFDAAGAVAFTVMGLTLSIAILRYRLFDVDIIIRRTLQYSVLSSLLALTYFGLVIVLQNLTSAIGGGQQSEFITVLSTLAIAALFFPLRNRVQEFIDKRFYRKKYDAQKVIADFAATCRDETDLDKLTARLVEVIDETLQPEKVSVWIKDNSKPKR